MNIFIILYFVFAEVIVMADKNNATCAICGKGYYMCASCKDKMSATPWKIHTDTSEHYKVFQIVKAHSLGVYDDNEARMKLKNVDLSDIETFKPEIKKIVRGIMNNGDSDKSRAFRRKRENETVEVNHDIEKLNDTVNTNTNADVDIKHESDEVEIEVENVS